MTTDIHSCSYFCERPECVRARRAREHTAPALCAKLREPIPWEPTGRRDRPTYQLWEHHCDLVDRQRVRAAEILESQAAHIAKLERDLMVALAYKEDSERLEWVLPMIGGDDDPEADQRAMAIAHQLMLGLTAKAAIDAARAKEQG